MGAGEGCEFSVFPNENNGSDENHFFFQFRTLLWIGEIFFYSEIEFWSIKLLLFLTHNLFFLNKFLISNASLYDFYFQRFDYL